MNGSTSRPDDDLEARSRALASAGEWERLRRVLSEVPASRLATSPALAYRYGEALYHTGRMSELAAFASTYEEGARASSDLPGTMRALNLSGIAAFELGDVERAKRRWEELMELADGAADPDMIARAANNLGAVANLRGDGHRALAFYRVAIPSYQRLGHRRGLAQTYHNLGISHRDIGEYDDAVAAFESAIEVAEEIPYQTLVVLSLVSRAELEIQRGDLRLAERLSERGLGLAFELDDPINEGGALRVRGVAKALADDTTGLDDLASALALARETENALLQAEASRDLGRARLARGDPGGRENLEAAIAAFDALGARAEVERLSAEIVERGS